MLNGREEAESNEERENFVARFEDEYHLDEMKYRRARLHGEFVKFRGVPGVRNDIVVHERYIKELVRVGDQDNE